MTPKMESQIAIDTLLLHSAQSQQIAQESSAIYLQSLF